MLNKKGNVNFTKIIFQEYKIFFFLAGNNTKCSSSICTAIDNNKINTL